MTNKTEDEDSNVVSIAYHRNLKLWNKHREKQVKPKSVADKIEIALVEYGHLQGKRDYCCAHCGKSNRKQFPKFICNNCFMRNE